MSKQTATYSRRAVLNRLAECEAEIARLQQERDRAQMLHDATCFTRPLVEAAKAREAAIARVVQELLEEADALDREPINREDHPALHYYRNGQSFAKRQLAERLAPASPQEPTR